MTVSPLHILRLTGALAAAVAAAFALAGAASAAPAAASEPEPTGGPTGRVLVGGEVNSYVRMASVRTALRMGRRSGPRATLEVAFALDAPDSATRRMIEQRQVWLRSAYSETLLLYGGRLHGWGEVPDLDRIGAMLQDDTDRLLGPGRAEVLLDTVLIHAG